jgi:hypothetical protein
MKADAQEYAFTDQSGETGDRRRSQGAFRDVRAKLDKSHEKIMEDARTATTYA